MGIDERAHRSESCHAVAISDNYWEEPAIEAVCTDPNSHRDLAGEEAARAARKAEIDREREAEEARTAARRAHGARLVATANGDDGVALAARMWLVSVPQPDIALVEEYLGLTAPSGAPAIRASGGHNPDTLTMLARINRRVLAKASGREAKRAIYATALAVRGAGRREPLRPLRSRRGVPGAPRGHWLGAGRRRAGDPRRAQRVLGGRNPMTDTTTTTTASGQPQTVNGKADHDEPSTVDGAPAGRVGDVAVCTTIVVASDKGGAGKTTAAVNIAAAAAAAAAADGRRVLLVDTDHQAAATAAVGVEVTKPTIYEVLAGRADAADATRPSAVAGLDVLPADGDLAAAQLELPAATKWRQSLRLALRPLRARYDLIVVDTPPGLNVVTFAALVAADQVLVACNPSFGDLRVLPNVFDAVARANTVPGTKAVVAGIIPSKVGRRTIHRDEVLAEITKRWPDLELPALPDRVVFQDSAVDGQPVTIFAPRSTAAQAVRTLTKEILDRATTP